MYFFFFSSRRRHTRYWRDWSSDVCSADLLAVAHLYVESELALVEDLAQLRRDRAGGALGGRRHVLDADLEAHGRPVVPQVLPAEDAGAALHHRDHSRSGEHLYGQRAP